VWRRLALFLKVPARPICRGEGNMKKLIRIEGIPNFAASIYSFIARKNPCIKDIHKEVVDEVSLNIYSGRILDVGTGPGYVPIEIVKKRNDLKVTGVDLSSKMVKIAVKAARKARLSSRADFKVANAGNLPFENEYFDFVISTLSFHHWSKPAEYLKEIHRVLKKGGKVYIYDLRRDTPKEVDSEVRKKYGWFLSFLLLKIIRAHSSITVKEAEEALSRVDADFSKKGIESRGVVIKLYFIK